MEIALEYTQAIEKSAKHIQAIQALGFDITYRHLPNSEQEIKFTKKGMGANQGIEMAFTKVLPSEKVLNSVYFCQHLEKIYL